MAAVSGIIPRSDAEMQHAASEVDYIVVNPYNEQTVSVPQHRYWPMFTPRRARDTRAAVQRLKFINTFLKITPVRDEVGQRMARLAADTFVKEVPKGSMINIGVGFPEEAVRVLIERGLEETYTFTTEAGSDGGLPAPGIFWRRDPSPAFGKLAGHVSPVPDRTRSRHVRLSARRPSGQRQRLQTGAPPHRLRRPGRPARHRRRRPHADLCRKLDARRRIPPGRRSHPPIKPGKPKFVDEVPR